MSKTSEISGFVAAGDRLAGHSTIDENPFLSQLFGTGDAPRMVTMQKFIDEGDIPSIGIVSGIGVDWGKEDEFTKTFDGKLTVGMLKAIEASPELQEVLKKNSWSHEDRVVWEKGVSEIISDQVHSIAGLKEYRSSSPSENLSGGHEVANRGNTLNYLSQDIKDGTSKMEFDCEQMSAVKGALLQMADNHFLGGGNENSGLKKSHDYYYTTGNSYGKDDGGALFVGHAYITSSATGNIIEATRDADNYLEGRTTFEEFASGKKMQVVVSGDLKHDLTAYGGSVSNSFLSDNITRTILENEGFFHKVNQLDDLVAAYESMPDVKKLAELSALIKENPNDPTLKEQILSNPLSEDALAIQNSILKKYNELSSIAQVSIQKMNSPELSQQILEKLSDAFPKSDAVLYFDASSDVIKTFTISDASDEMLIAVEQGAGMAAENNKISSLDASSLDQVSMDRAMDGMGNPEKAVGSTHLAAAAANQLGASPDFIASITQQDSKTHQPQQQPDFSISPDLPRSEMVMG